MAAISKDEYRDTIKRKKLHKARNNAQMYGNMFDKLWTERIDIMAGPEIGGVEHKLGPREIGTIHGWKGYKYDDGDDAAFLSDRTTTRKKDYSQLERPVKLGPREIGKVHGWKGYKYDDADDGDFLADKSRSKKKKINEEEKASMVKQGPRDIGTTHGWRGLKFDGMYFEQLRFKKLQTKHKEKKKRH